MESFIRANELGHMPKPIYSWQRIGWAIALVNGQPENNDLDDIFFNRKVKLQPLNSEQNINWNAHNLISSQTFNID